MIRTRGPRGMFVTIRFPAVQMCAAKRMTLSDMALHFGVCATAMKHVLRGMSIADWKQYKDDTSVKYGL